MANQGQRDAVVQAEGRSVNGDYKAWQVRTKPLTKSQEQQRSNDLKSDLGASGGGVKNVSSGRSATRSRSTRSTGSSSRCS